MTEDKHQKDCLIRRSYSSIEKRAIEGASRRGQMQVDGFFVETTTGRLWLGEPGRLEGTIDRPDGELAQDA